ncbi:MAG: tripartite tricarboxylate transporter substrate binding protein [Betaproteobacteria bacterium]|nr:MAG: tripartite tricarboxylate transporter substrate binding protein [Betaproteobacteria bacterium]
MRILLVFALLALAAGLAQSQQYPTKPVRIIAPFAPGGGTDFIARLIAQKLTERLGPQVIVENKPGAGGNLGAEFAVKSAPDGYTLLLVAGSYTVNPSLYKLSFDPVNDITPIVQLSQGPFVVAVHPSVPANNLKELIELARRQPDKLSYASAGSGSITHLASELFLDMAKIKIVHIPYKGTGPALNDTIAGSTQLIFGSVSTTLQFIKSGRLRGLAVTTPRRISALPDLPTVAEAGVPGYEVVLWHGLVAPKGVPRPIVDRLNREANEVLKAKDMGDLLATDGVAPAGGTPEQFRAVIKADIGRWRGVVKQANIKLD